MRTKTSEEADQIAKDLSIRRYFILKALCEKSLPQTKLAEVGEFSTAAMTGIRDRLLQQGLVTSAAPDMSWGTDRRKVFTEITTKGREVVKVFESIVLKMSASIK